MATQLCRSRWWPQAEAYATQGYFHYTSSKLKPIILDFTRSKNKNQNLDLDKSKRKTVTTNSPSHSAGVSFHDHLEPPRGSGIFSEQGNETQVENITPEAHGACHSPHVNHCPSSSNGSQRQKVTHQSREHPVLAMTTRREKLWL